MTIHTSFLHQAIELAVDNVKHSGGPFGAIIIFNDMVIATGVNRVTATHDPTAHAEIVAIRAACTYLNSFQLTDCILYSSCEPCPMCLGAIYWARPSAVYYASSRFDAAAVGFDDSFIYEQLALPADQRSIATQQIVTENHSAPFDLWRQTQEKIEY